MSRHATDYVANLPEDETSGTIHLYQGEVVVFILDKLEGTKQVELWSNYLRGHAGVLLLQQLESFARI